MNIARKKYTWKNPGLKNKFQCKRPGKYNMKPIPRKIYTKKRFYSRKSPFNKKNPISIRKPPISIHKFPGLIKQARRYFPVCYRSRRYYWHFSNDLRDQIALIRRYFKKTDHYHVSNKDVQLFYKIMEDIMVLECDFEVLKNKSYK